MIGNYSKTPFLSSLFQLKNHARKSVVTITSPTDKQTSSPIVFCRTKCWQTIWQMTFSRRQGDWQTDRSTHCINEPFSIVGLFPRDHTLFSNGRSQLPLLLFTLTSNQQQQNLNLQISRAVKNWKRKKFRNANFSGFETIVACINNKATKILSAHSFSGCFVLPDSLAIIGKGRKGVREGGCRRGVGKSTLSNLCSGHSLRNTWNKEK